ncbi:MAG TPA: sterol desaturase family protein [Alphaproteobacteria bacterium]|jgi:sterol desaturase/sphingolipid hydroxylase (fatty acid hydroxylase superfamily)
MTLANVPPPALGDSPLAVAAAHSGRMAPPHGSGNIGDWLGWTIDTAARTYATDLVYYILGAGLTYLLLWVVFRGRLAHRRIDPAYPEARHLRREILFSLASLAVFAVIGVGLTFAALAGWTRLYIDFGAYGWFYWLASIAALLVLHDAYFYWTHRLMHHRLLFKQFHRLHHRSHNPSPWAAYAFAPPEAFVQGLFLTAASFVLPLHPTAILVFILHQIFRNALGHSGFEIYPAHWQRHPLLKWINTTSHHHLHHSKGRGNYGLYFLWWDRLMGTEHPDAAATFARASAARAAAPAAEPSTASV